MDKLEFKKGKDLETPSGFLTQETGVMSEIQSHKSILESTVNMEAIEPIPPKPTLPAIPVGPHTQESSTHDDNNNRDSQMTTVNNGNQEDTQSQVQRTFQRRMPTPPHWDCYVGAGYKIDFFCLQLHSGM